MHWKYNHWCESASATASEWHKGKCTRLRILWSRTYCLFVQCRWLIGNHRVTESHFHLLRHVIRKPGYVRPHGFNRGSFIAKMLVRSPQNLFIFMIFKNIFRIKVSVTQLIYFWKQKHWVWRQEWRAVHHIFVLFIFKINWKASVYT